MTHRTAGKTAGPRKAPKPARLVDVVEYRQDLKQVNGVPKKLQVHVKTHQWGVSYPLAKWLMEQLREQKWLPKGTYFKTRKHKTPADIEKERKKKCKQLVHTTISV
jgi:hypothetical protein